jgi:hypothetical protein
MIGSGSRHVPLSLSRRLACDVMHFSQKVPLVVVERRMELAELVAARQRSQPKPSWFAVFMKAYGIVCSRHAELRRSYLRFPWPRMCEHADSVASMPMERQLDGEEVIAYVQFPCPDKQPIVDLDASIRQHKNEPIENVSFFQTQLKISRLPQFIRRPIWWLGLNLNGSLRKFFFGTFGISAVSGFGGNIMTILSPLTTTLTYGIFETNGSVSVRLIFDHRVMDGANPARALVELEDVLMNEVLAELRQAPLRLAA